MTSPIAHQEFHATFTHDGETRTVTIISGVGTRQDEIRGSVANMFHLPATVRIVVTKGPRV